MISERCKLSKITTTRTKYQPKFPEKEKNTKTQTQYPQLPSPVRQIHAEPINHQGKTHLHLVCSPLQLDLTLAKRLTRIDSLIDRGCNVNATDSNGLSVLHYAVENCSSSVVEKLVSRGATVGLFQMNKTRESPLHLAVKSRCKDTVHALLKAVEDIDALDANKLSALHYAVIQNDADIVKSLISHGANMNAKENNFGLTTIHLAVLFSMPMPGEKVDLNASADEDVTPLHLALLEGNGEAVERLVKLGADVNLREGTFGFTPMHLTAFTSSEKEVEFLATRGADVNSSTEKGITPLHLASMLGNVEVVKALIARGADVYRRDKILGSTALHWAAMTGQALNLKSLLSDRRDEKSRMRHYWNLKFSQTDEIDLIEMLMKNVPESAALTTITLKPIGKIMEILLECGTVAEVKDHDGRSFLDLILDSDNIEGLEYLLEFGVDFNDSEIIDKVLRSNGKVRDLWVKHIIKLKAVDMPVSKFYSLSSFPDFYETCEQEVNKMKDHKLGLRGERTTLYDLLHMQWRSRIRYVEYVTSLDMKSRYPEYYGIVWASCLEAVDRPQLLEEAKKALWKMMVGLPDLCMELILSYLGNGQLKVLIDAGKNVQGIW